ncbi:MAG: hypothetical protein KDB18_00325, partial [Salinibacterium sp.]|nr:hypothetical protein [Salinibacterium sp.]
MASSPPSRGRDQSRTGERRGQRRWGRRILITLVVLIGVGAVSWWAFKGPITKAFVLGKLTETLGARVDASTVDLLSDGSLELRDVVIRAPGLGGEPGEVLKAERVHVALEFGSDGPTPKRVQIDRPLIRLSIDRDGGSVNLAGLRLKKGDDGPRPLLLPEIEITEGRLEFGEHGPGGYAELKSVPLVGEVTPMRDEQGYALEVRTVSGESAAPSVPMRIVGSLRESGIELRLDRVRLQEWVPSAVPTAYRELIDSLDIHGDVSSVAFSAAMDGSQLQTEVSLQGVRMKLPIGDWLSTEGEPIDAAVRTGTLRLRDRGLQIELDTVAAGVPMAIKVQYHGLTTDSPFEAVVQVRAYAMPKDPPWLEYMPEGVQWRIESFANPTAVVDATINAVRAQAGGDPSISGEATFRDGVAAFHAFPYEVRSLSGTVKFNSEELLLEGIRGVSAQGARVQASGRIAPPGDGAAVALDINVEDAPLDDAM